jgi:hypothetical protein
MKTGCVLFEGTWTMAEICESTRSKLHDLKSPGAHPVGHIFRPWGYKGVWYRDSSDHTGPFVSHDQGKTWAPKQSQKGS